MNGKCPRTKKPVDPALCRKCKYLGELYFRGDKLTGVVCFPYTPANRREVRREGKPSPWKSRVVVMGVVDANQT